jgi:hypothetical protein
VPPDAPVTGAAPDFDRHFRRAVWITALVAVVIAAVVYADKAADDRSAFIRWRPQVLQFWRGVNIYDKMMFPNPPIMPITLYPLMSLPPLQGAMAWYALKVTLTALSVWLCFRMVRPDDRVLPSWVQGAVLLMSFRTVLSDLHHGNNNLIILFLVVACLSAWRKGYDVLAGMVLALAISYKVTPALFVLYFAYKRSWRTVGATLLGMGVFLLIVPGVVVGPSFNGECLAAWWRRILSPYLDKGVISQQEINQSMVGVLTRLLTNSRTGTGRYDVHLDVNLVSWPPRAARVALPDEDRPSRRPSSLRRVRAGGPDDAVRLGAELEAPLRDAAVTLHLSDVPRRGVRDPAEGEGGPRVGHGSLGADDGDDLERAWRALRPQPGAQDRAGVRHVPLVGGGRLRGDGLDGQARGPCRACRGLARIAPA